MFFIARVSLISAVRRLVRLAPAIGRRLIGDARVMRAIGQARERLAAAEEEVRACGIADRPVAGGFVQFEQRQPLAHRHHIVIGDRIGLELDLEGLRQRGVAARHRARHPHHVLGGARLALPRHGRSTGSWRGRKGRAGAPCRSPRCASHFRVPRRSGWPKVRLSQSFFSCSTRSSDQVNTVIALFLRLSAARSAGGAAMPNLQKIPVRRIP